MKGPLGLLGLVNESLNPALSFGRMSVHIFLVSIPQNQLIAAWTSSKRGAAETSGPTQDEKNLESFEGKRCRHCRTSHKKAFRMQRNHESPLTSSGVSCRLQKCLDFSMVRTTGGLPIKKTAVAAIFPRNITISES
jgi:hypothetical protein